MVKFSLLPFFPLLAYQENSSLGSSLKMEVKFLILCHVLSSR